MARGGINKALVKQSRDALLSRGQNPSIDAIRIELGNTGSKTTIHRYLRELDKEESTRLDDEALLSNTLRDMVARLASRLHEEAGMTVRDIEERHGHQRSEWQNLRQTLEKELSDSRNHFVELEQQLTESEQERVKYAETTQNLNVQTQRQAQKLADMESLIGEKDEHIRSLEDKHRHSREALEHYRQSVKEQREQDQRRHDQEVQQLRAELRQLGQTLSIKQEDITRLNRDNARLVSEIEGIRKQLSDRRDLASRLKASEDNATLTTQKLAELRGKMDQQFKDLLDRKTELEQSEKSRLTLEIELAKLRTELEVKNALFEKMGLTT